MARQSSNNTDYKLPLEAIYTAKVFVPESEMLALADACSLHNAQAHRSLVPVNEIDYEVVIQISASSRDSANSIFFYIGSSYASKLSTRNA